MISVIHQIVTEEEIWNGILNTKSPETECFWFKRTFTDLEEHKSDKMARRFMDIASGEIDEEAQNFLQKLKLVLRFDQFDYYY